MHAFYHDINRLMTLQLIGTKRGIVVLWASMLPTITARRLYFESDLLRVRSALLQSLTPADPQVDHHRPTARTSQDNKKREERCANCAAARTGEMNRPTML